MKLSEKLKEADAPLNENELKELINDIETLEDQLKTEKEKTERLNGIIEDFNDLENYEKAEEKTEIKYMTGPTEVKISDGKEEIKVDFRIVAGVGKTKGSFVFNGILEKEPEKETGKTYRKHEINGKTIFVIYKR